MTLPFRLPVTSKFVTLTYDPYDSKAYTWLYGFSSKNMHKWVKRFRCCRIVWELILNDSIPLFFQKNISPWIPYALFNVVLLLFLSPFVFWPDFISVLSISVSVNRIQAAKFAFILALILYDLLSFQHIMLTHLLNRVN